MEAGLIADDGLVEELDRWKGWTQLRSLHALRKGELAQELRRACPLCLFPSHLGKTTSECFITAACAE